MSSIGLTRSVVYRLAIFNLSLSQPSNGLQPYSDGLQSSIYEKLTVHTTRSAKEVEIG